ncbi:MAG: hypothetical protein WCC32_11480 [Terriglobales bacterium]
MGVVEDVRKQLQDLVTPEMRSLSTEMKAFREDMNHRFDEVNRRFDYIERSFRGRAYRRRRGSNPETLQAARIH